MRSKTSTSAVGQRAWSAASVLLLAAGLCLPGSLFGRDGPQEKQTKDETKEKQIKAVEKELNDLTGKLKALKESPESAKPPVSAGVPQDWLKSLTWALHWPEQYGRPHDCHFRFRTRSEPLLAGNGFRRALENRE